MGLVLGPADHVKSHRCSILSGSFIDTWKIGLVPVNWATVEQVQMTQGVACASDLLVAV